MVIKTKIVQNLEKLTGVLLDAPKAGKANGGLA